jgi:hypothetical protein
MHRSTSILLAGTLGVGFALIGPGATKSTAQPVAKAQVAQDTNTNPVVLSGKYSDLHPEQKRLVDDWFRRLSEVLKQQASGEEGYENLPLSDKTTFSAVTHALLRTKLTDQSGAALGESAMTLVDRIDQVLGKVEGAGGDKQFRIYVQLKPNALEILERSQEFSRAHDNTVYHKGFPVCYRSQGTPSIQISITRDGRRADIDVDYRSSQFPVALINGHLNSSNSDIRADNNDERHNSRWTGVSNWWRSLLGLPLDGDRPKQEDTNLESPPRTKENAKPAVAVHDFLQVWLVDRKPQEVISYFSETAFSCMELEQGRPVDLGVARFSMFMGLRQINEAIGTVTNLPQVVVGVPVSKPELRAIDQPYKNEFTLYDVREDLAERFNCANKLDPSQISAKAAKSTAFGKYVGAVFYLKTPQGAKGATVATLWAKQNKYWKLISYVTDLERGSSPTNAIVPAVEAPVLALDPGDKQLIAASTDFYQKWFVRRRFTEAFQYLSPRAYPCANVYRSEEIPEPGSPAEAAQLIQQGLERLANFAGSVRKLEDAITAPQPSHPDLKLVQHADSTAFAMVAVPDSMAQQADCSKMKPGESSIVSTPTSAPNSYGQYYATGFRLTKAAEEPSVLWIVWGRESDQWRIIAYHVLTP